MHWFVYVVRKRHRQIQQKRQRQIHRQRQRVGAQNGVILLIDLKLRPNALVCKSYYVYEDKDKYKNNDKDNEWAPSLGTSYSSISNFGQMNW